MILQVCIDCPTTFPPRGKKIRCSACRASNRRLDHHKTKRKTQPSATSKAKIRTAHFQYAQRPENRAKRSAYKKVRRAIASGLLKRGPCEQCSAPNTHAHHDDYAKPLDVRWLCSPCHTAYHAAENKKLYGQNWRSARRILVAPAA